MGYLPGEQHPNATLTTTQVESIRHEYKPGLVSYQTLAHKYCVSKTSISRIINGITWVAETQLPDTTN